MTQRCCRFLLVMALPMSGCIGNIGGTDSSATPPAATTSAVCAGAPSPGPSPLRRLTRHEYDRTVHDLLGTSASPGASFVPEAEIAGFDNAADGAATSPVVIEQYERAAFELASEAVLDLEGLLGCDAALGGEDECARAFLERFGRRAFRRPLNDEELAAWDAFYGDQKLAYGHQDAIRNVVSAILQAPQFLYRTEVGRSVGASEAAIPLTGFERASRLSYFVTGSMPDDALLDAAESGVLDDATGVRDHAERLLDDDQRGIVAKRFFSQWAGIADLPQRDLNDSVSADMAELLLAETEAFVDDVVRHGDGRFETLMTAPHTFMSAKLAGFYGIEGELGSSFERVDLDEDRYGGLLTQGSVMSALSHQSGPSIVRRGKFVMERLFCMPELHAPDNADTTPPETDPSGTARQKLEQRTSGQACSSCHSILNGPGFAFEHFDASGRWRDSDGEAAIDSTGQLVTTDVDGPLADHMSVIARVAESDQAMRCIERNWFRFAYGREPTDADRCAQEELSQVFQDSDGNIRALILALTQTSTFLFRSPHDAGP